MNMYRVERKQPPPREERFFAERWWRGEGKILYRGLHKAENKGNSRLWRENVSVGSRGGGGERKCEALLRRWRKVDFFSAF